MFQNTSTGLAGRGRSAVIQKSNSGVDKKNMLAISIFQQQLNPEEGKCNLHAFKETLQWVRTVGDQEVTLLDLYDKYDSLLS